MKQADKQGVARLNIAAGKYRLGMTSRDMKFSEDIDVTPGGDNVFVVEGQTVYELICRVVNSDTRDTIMSVENFGLLMEDKNSPTGYSRHGAAYGLKQTEPVFKLPGLDEGVYRVEIHHKGYQPYMGDPFKLDASSELREHLFELEPTDQSGAISGVVKTPDGLPAERTRIASIIDDEGDMWHSSVETDENGEYLIEDLSAGVYIVQFARSNYFHRTRLTVPHISEPLEVREDKTTTYNIVLDPAGLMQIVMRDPNGDPIGEVRLTLVNEQGNLLDPPDPTIYGAKAPQTDEFGDYLTHPIPPGAYTVLATREGWRQLPMESPIAVRENDIANCEIIMEPLGP